MGIRGLMKYLEEHCPEAWDDNVRIADMIERCREQTGRKPEIVVDGNVCYSMWTRGLDWTIGLEVGKLKMNLTRFVNAFQQLGADLVFFFDGLTPRKKRGTWLERRRDSLRTMGCVYNGLRRGIPFYNLPSYIPPSMTTFVTFFLKYELGCKVYVTVHESDEEIVDYVAENKHSLIFTFDSDLIISHVDDSYVLSSSSDHFKIETMTTRVYDRRGLCSHLGLKPIELPYLGILAGNDLVDRRLLEPFHCRITGRRCRYGMIPFKILIKCLAEYIISSLPRHLSANNHVKTICYDMFGNRLKTPFLRMAHKSYFPNRRSKLSLDDSPWSQVLIEARELMRKVILPASAWGVLSAHIYESNPVCENYYESSDRSGNSRDNPCATITRPLRKRWYGILLLEKRDESRPVVEWCAENFQSYNQPVLVDPEYPSVPHPGLRVLWNQNCTDTKWIQFLKIVSPNIENFDEWKSLPEDFVISTAVCYYLFEGKHVNNDELRALLVTLVMFKYYTLDDLERMRRRSPNRRARKIRGDFSRTHSNMFSIFASCGFPVPLSKNIAYIKFEPLLFEEILEKVQARTSLGELCLGNMEAMNVFHQMKKIIYKSHRG